MFSQVAYKFLEHFRVIKNASSHTLRNYAIDINSLKEYLEQEVVKCKPAETPGKIRYEEFYDRRWKENDSTLSFPNIRKTSTLLQ